MARNLELQIKNDLNGLDKGFNFQSTVLAEIHIFLGFYSYNLKSGFAVTQIPVLV